MRCFRSLPVFAALSAALLLAAACSKSDGATSASAPVHGPGTPIPIVHVGWGSGPDALGHNLPDEGASEGPGGLTVGADGQVYVLDQLNQRIQRFKPSGTPNGSIPLPEGVFDDVELDGDAGFVLLDRFQRASIVYIDLAGAVRKEVTLAGTGIPEPSLITAMFLRSDGVWVEVNDSDVIRVANAKGEPDPDRPAVGGRFNPKGDTVFRQIVADDLQSLTMSKQAVPSGSPLEWAQTTFDGEIGATTGLEIGAEKVYLSLRVQQLNPSDPAQIISQSHLLVGYGADGKELGRQTFPADTGAEEVFRPLRLGRDGNLYFIRCTEAGVEIVKVTP